MESIADRIKSRRKELKMTQRDLANLVGIKQQSIHQIESGLTRKPRYLFEIALVLKCEISWLLAGTPIQSLHGIQKNNHEVLNGLVSSVEPNVVKKAINLNLKA